MKPIVKDLVDIVSAILIIFLIFASFWGFFKMADYMAKTTVTAVQQK